MVVFKAIYSHLGTNIILLLLMAVCIGLLCVRSTDPVPDDDRRDDIDFIVFQDSTGMDTLKSGDTLMFGDTLWFYLRIYHLEDKDTLTFTFKNKTGISLLDSTVSFLAGSNITSDSLLYCMGFYTFSHPVTDSFSVTIETDLIYTKKYELHVLNLIPVIENAGTVYFDGISMPDSACVIYVKVLNTTTTSYQWYKNNAVQPGKNSDSLFFSPFTVSDTGNYYCIASSNLGSDTSLVYHLTIGNRPPKWVSDTFHASVYESTSITIVLSDSCSDPDNDPLQFAIEPGKPLGDTVSDSGIYTFTPSFQDAGKYEVHIKASDGITSIFTKVLLTVHNKNRKPVFVDSLPRRSYQINEGDTLVINLKTVDPDGDPVVYSLGPTTLPNPQNIAINDSRIVWPSGVNDNGLYSIEIIAADSVDSQKAVVHIAVGNVNLPPQMSVNGLLSGDTVTIKEKQTFLCTLLVTDPNIEDKAVFLPVKNAPVSVQYNVANGIFAYTPEFNVSTGLVNHTFPRVTFFATDNVDPHGIDSFVIHITVLDSNSAPFSSKTGDSITVTEGKNAVYTLTEDLFLDNEGDKINFSSSFGSFNPDTTQWIWPTVFTSAGSVICTIIASDNHIPPASSGLPLFITITDSVVPVILNNPYDVTHDSLKISWSKSTEPEFESYRIFYDTAANVSVQSPWSLAVQDISDTNAVIHQLDQHTHYYLKVFTYNTKQTMSGSNEVDTTTDIQPPLIFINTPLITRDSGFIQEVDPTIAGSIKSLIGIKQVTASINGKPFFPGNIESLSWKLNAASSDTGKWNKITVKAESIRGDTSDTSFYFYLKPKLATPQPPEFTDSTNRSITMSLTAVKYCTHYLLYHSSKGKDGPYEIVKTRTSNSLGSITDTNLEINSQYWYKVRGYYFASGGFNESDTTEYSAVGTKKTKNLFMKTFGFPDKNTEGMSVRQTTDGGYIITGRVGVSGNYDVYLIKTDKKGDTLWTRTFGEGNKNERGQSVRQTDDDGYIIAGYNESSGAGGLDIFLIKTDANGNKIWEKPYRGSGNNGLSVEQTGDNGYILVGSTNLLGAGGTDVLLIKTKADGTEEWAKPFGGISHDYGNSVRQIEGGYIIVGSTLSFSAGNFDVLLIKTNTDGNLIRLNTFGGDKVDRGHSVEQTRDGGYIIAGSTNSYGKGGSDVFLIKTGSDGTEKWKKTFGGTANEYGRSVQQTSDGYIIVGESDPYGAGIPDVYLIKTDNSGDEIWSKTFGGINSDYGNSVRQTFDKGFVVVGHTRSFGNPTFHKVYLIKTDENGVSAQ